MSALWTSPQAPCSSRGVSSGAEPSGGVLTSEFHLQGTVQCVDGRSFDLFSTLNFLLCVQLAVGPAGGTVQVNTVQVKAAVRTHAAAIGGPTGRDCDSVCSAGLQLSVALLVLLGNTCWDWLNALGVPRPLSLQRHLLFK